MGEKDRNTLFLSAPEPAPVSLAEPQVHLVGRPGHHQGWHLGPRAIDHEEFVLIEQGRYCYQPDDGPEVVVNPHEVLHIPAHTTHQLSRIDNSQKKGRLIFILHSPNHHISHLPPSLITLHHHRDRVQQLFNHIHQTWIGRDQFRAPLMQTMVRELWLRLISCWQLGDQNITKRSEPMCAFLKENLHRNISRNELAERFGLTPTYVSQLFAQEQGIGPNVYLRRLRMQRALQLLQDSGNSIAAIARDCGYEDAQYFARLFKREMGITPSAARRW